MLPRADPAAAPGGGGSGRLGVPTGRRSLLSTKVAATDSLVNGPPVPAAAAAAEAAPALITTAAPPCNRERRRPEKLGGVVVVGVAWRLLGGRRDLEGLLVHRRERLRTVPSIPRRVGGAAEMKADAVEVE